MSLKNTLNGLLDWRLEHKIWRISEKREKKALAMNGYSTGKAEGEDAYLRKWAPLLRFQTPYAYRLYSRYCGTTPDILSQTMSLIGGLTTPLSMLLIGTRISGIRLSELRDKDYHITAALRLIVLPLILYVLLLPLHLDPAVWSTLYLLTAMPCGTLSAMQAELYGGDARFAARAIAYSTLLSLVTVPLISMLL